MTTQEEQRRLRELPSIDRLLAASGHLIADHGHHATVAALRSAVGAARERVRDGAAPSQSDLIAVASQWLHARHPSPPRKVINATGVVVHTNLGRAPLAPAAREAVLAASGYCDLEYDLETGGRGTRTTRLEPLLCAATGAQAAFVVNNAAAALVLSLAALAAGRDVAVSRGELIEIGGSFRLPDVMAASGARLREVGTTNRTRASDFAGGDDVAAILTLHPSNYRIVGFVEQPMLPDLADVAAARGVPLVYDVGSGLLTPTDGVLANEPSVAGALRDGADLVLCSGDKLLGGPQAGLLVGRRDLVDACRRHPLARALRLDKLRIAALHATLELHLRERTDEVPVHAMLHADTAVLADRSDTLATALTAAGLAARVDASTGLPGGGAAPDAHLPGPVVRLRVPRPHAVAAALRHGAPPIVVRVADDRVVIDLRTVVPDDDPVVAGHICTAVRATDRGPQ